MIKRFPRFASALVAGLVFCLAAPHALGAKTGTRFEVSFSAAAHAGPITGRVFVIVGKSESPEPRLQVGSWGGQTPFFGVDVDQLKPGQTAVIDAGTLGYPVASLRDIPAGDYFVQALLNVYTRFPRSDGHVIWAHMDQWEGQQFNRAPGNLFSEIKKARLDPAAGYAVKLELAKVIPPIEVPADTEWVKRVKLQSKLLTAFWGRPIDLGATVVLPKGYDAHPDVRYPVVYNQGHFGLGAPFGFRADRAAEGRRGGHTGLYQAWISEDFPRLILVNFLHPTPYYDDSYAVDSANNGPYGQAIMTELIPYLEEHFRILRQPYARLLTGGSTGGWESLALQVFHPDFFGGTWTFCPDPVDFRRFQLINIYSDANAFLAPGGPWMVPERPMMRTVEGQVTQTVRQMSRLEDVLGSKGRSGQQFAAFEAVFGPVGDDGYPRPLWDRRTGKIDRDVANYMRDHGYDLRHTIESRWPEIGPQLAGKLHFYCGDMDNYYLNLALYMLEAYLEKTTDPPYGGSFEWGRPMKGHGWSPLATPELLKLMAERVIQNGPKDAAPAPWQYK